MHPVAENWLTTPITRPRNSLTGSLEGDDAGFRDVVTLRENPADLVIPNVEIRAPYDGVDEFGEPAESLRLGGGLEGGRQVVRSSVAFALELGDSTLQEYFRGDYRLVLLDGFRSGQRQGAGFAGMLKHFLKKGGFVNPSPAELVENARLGDAMFSYVNADTTSPLYATLVTEFKCDDSFMASVRDLAARDVGGSSKITPKKVDDVLREYISASANSGVGRAGESSLPLDCEKNGHAGGGAVDLMILDRHGKPVSIAPFDFVGRPSSVDYLENDANFDHFRDMAQENAALQEHLRRLGFSSPEQFSINDWLHFRAVARIRHHLMMALGSTYYSAPDPEAGGEFWHYEPGNIVYNPVTGDETYCEPDTASGYPNSGNPAHTLQKVGRDGIAVWGGASAHRIAREKHGLED